MLHDTVETSIDTQGRSVVKAVTWRITGSVDTIVLGSLFYWAGRSVYKNDTLRPLHDRVKIQYHCHLDQRERSYATVDQDLSLWSR